MQLIPTLIIAALTFGICYFFDKGYTHLFRSKAQHQSGLAVRLSKRYALFGLILLLLGLLAIFTGISGSTTALWLGGCIVLLMGIGLLTYYLTFGIFYDSDSFILTTFGKKSTAYRFADIRTQMLYVVQGGNIIVELHLADGRAVGLQSTMDGTFAFLDHAFAAWCRQTGRDPQNCPFHNPAESVWFPTEEDC